MPLQSGTRLGPYEIIALVGAGSTGEVYRASDERLQRDVALKILAPEVAGDASRRQRFEMEARAMAALSHPNIVAVYDFASENGVAYIVSELVEGESLRGRTFGLRKALDIAVQIADGLGSAHEAGIVHRDLKPENILLSREGVVKIADFSLAKSVRVAAPKGDETVTMRTEPGVVMGTVGYMSPEQVRGEDAGYRSDIFSFGLMLYELLDGKRAFDRGTAVETMAAILKEDAPELTHTLPAGLRHIVARCLEKEPRDRFQSAKDLAFAMREIGGTGGSRGGVAAVGRWNKYGRVWLIAAGLAPAAIALVAGHFYWPAESAVSWSGVPLGGPELAMNPRLSPEGHTLAFEAFVGAQTQVAIMKPDAGNWSVLTHNQDRGSVAALSWSHDGNRIYYDRALDVPRGIYSISVLGGDEQLVLEDAMYPEVLPDGSLIVARLNARHELQLFRFWPESGRLDALPLQVDVGLFIPQVRASPNGREVVVIGTAVGQPPEPAKDLYVLDLTSGNVRRLVKRPNPFRIRAPAVTRGGRSILFSEQGPYQMSELAPGGSSPVRVMFPLTSMVWSADTAPDGSVYIDQAARPVSLVRFPERGGHAVELARYPALDDFTQFAPLPDGRTVWKQQIAGRTRLVIVEEGKSPIPLASTADETTFPVALDGSQQVAFAIGKDRRTIGIASLETGRIIERIAFDKAAIDTMVATPDGRTLYFTAAGSIWRQPAAGGSATQVRDGDAIAMDPAGKYMAVIDLSKGRTRLLQVPLDGSAEREVPISGKARPSVVESGAISKDGKLLLGLQAPDSWFIDPAVIDLATGHATRIPIDTMGDTFSMSWTADGQIMSAVVGLRASLWRFQRRARE